jgi:hypothetical protein
VREHGWQSAKIDRGSEDELQAVVQARKAAAVDEFHSLAEPTRGVASDFRRAAIDEAIRRARTDEMKELPSRARRGGSGRSRALEKNLEADASVEMAPGGSRGEIDVVGC